MILQALAAYYDLLINDPKSGVAQPGYSDTPVSSAFVLDAKGELVNIIPTLETVTRGKKQFDVSQRMMVPARVKRSSGVKPNLFCDNATYVLGLEDPKKKEKDYANKRFEAFKNLHLKIIQDLDTPSICAFRSFLQDWRPELIETSPVLQAHMDELLKGGNIVFRLDGQLGYLHQQPEFIDLISQKDGGENVSSIRQCLVTGAYAPVARLHSNIAGIKGANSTGATLVGFNADAFTSYNLSQGDNSPVSESAMFAYTTALNYLTSKSNPHRPLQLGDMTVVYWAESTSPLYADIFSAMLDPELTPPSLTELTSVAYDAQRLMSSIAMKIADGKPLESDALSQELDLKTKFYVLGISPNVKD
jgi:CRISPR-associated protein Csd1